MKKNYTIGSFDMLPMKEFTKTVFGESAEDFDETVSLQYTISLSTQLAAYDWTYTPAGGSAQAKQDFIELYKQAM